MLVKFLLHFDPVANVLTNGVEVATFRQFFLIDHYLFDTNFSGEVVELISCIIRLKKFFSLTMVAIEMGKRHYFSYHSNNYKGDGILYQKHESFTR